MNRLGTRYMNKISKSSTAGTMFMGEMKIIFLKKDDGGSSRDEVCSG